MHILYTQHRITRLRLVAHLFFNRAFTNNKTQRQRPKKKPPSKTSETREAIFVDFRWGFRPDSECFIYGDYSIVFVRVEDRLFSSFLLRVSISATNLKWIVDCFSSAMYAVHCFFWTDRYRSWNMIFVTQIVELTMTITLLECIWMVISKCSVRVMHGICFSLINTKGKIIFWVCQAY